MSTTLTHIIQNKLQKALSAQDIFVKNQSHLHRHHSHSPGGEDTHFDIFIVSKAFEGMGRVKRQQMVYDLLKEEMDGGVHAISMKLRAPNDGDK